MFSVEGVKSLWFYWYWILILKWCNPDICFFADRYLTLQIATQYDEMSVQEKREIIGTLTSLTSKCEGTVAPLALDSGVILPPVPLTNIPIIK